MRLFARRPTEGALKKPKPERLPPAALARLERERREAEVAEERAEASARAIREHVERYGFWFPSDGQPAPSRLSGRPSWPARLVERIFAGWS
jgi:hypothetical protein